MYALTVTSKKQLERATSRAQVQKPKIEEVEFGIYNVWSTDPKKPNTFYIVGIQPARDGGYEVACGCPTQNYFCKHVSACFGHYLLREKEQLQQPDPLICECGKAGFSFFNNRWYCISCIKDMAAKEEVTCQDCQAPATSGEGRCFECQLRKDNSDLFGI